MYTYMYKYRSRVCVCYWWVGGAKLVLLLPYFLEFFPPLNCSHTEYLARVE